MTKEEITWDLSKLFSGFNDPKIEKIIENSKTQVEQFIKDYKGKIKAPGFNASDLQKLFQREEEFEANLDELLTYAYILYDSDMQIIEHEALKNKTTEFLTDVHKKLTFLELEVGKFVFENKDLLNDPALQNYRHYLEKIARAYPHLLSEVEEQLILEKDQYGIIQWSQLQGKWLNTRQFHVMAEGEEKILSYGEANALLEHPDRDTRISAEKSIYSTLGKDEYIFSTALRNICSDWMKTVERRNYYNAMHHSLIVNDTEQEIIESLMKTMEENAHVYQRYLKLKAKLLKLERLNYADVLAPLLEMPDKKYSWEESKKLILESYRNFDKQFEEIALDMFKKHHIDATIRMGKRNGAYCASWYNGKSAFILTNFNGQMGDIYTLTHELGHAVHDYLAADKQTYLNLHPGYTTSECASIFGELLMTDLLLETSESDNIKKAILAHVLDDAGMAAFQVSARYWFEWNMYNALKNNEYLDGQTISKYWIAGRDKIYGDSIDFFDELKWEWTMKSHYFRVGFRFYNYPYVYAQLFVYALYNVYKREGKVFVLKFKKLLASGGSVSPKELANIVGLDITKSEFWKLGIKQYEDFVNQLEKLMS
ncbi:MAG: M3 family metallopeptidase [Candidatus Hermodarchaeota archaeon]